MEEIILEYENIETSPHFDEDIDNVIDGIDKGNEMPYKNCNCYSNGTMKTEGLWWCSIHGWMCVSKQDFVILYNKLRDLEEVDEHNKSEDNILNISNSHE